MTPGVSRVKVAWTILGRSGLSHPNASLRLKSQLHYLTRSSYGNPCGEVAARIHAGGLVTA